MKLYLAMKTKFVILFFILTHGISYAQIVTTIAGTGVAGYVGDGGVATAAKLDHPDRIIFHSGNMYIADEHNHVIRKIDPSGIITTIAGTGYGSGSLIGGYSGDGGHATNARLNRPMDIAFDKIGNLYIAELGNSTIRKVTPSGIISTYAGIGSAGTTGDGGLATQAKIFDPLGLTFDAEGNLYFSCNGTFRIRKISTNGMISTIVGNGIYGYDGDSGPATNAKISFTAYLSLDTEGNIYFGDYPNHRIRKVNLPGIISTIGGNGIMGNTGDGGLISVATFAYPVGIIFDVAGNMYISDKDYGLIRKVNTLGIITTIAGTGTVGFNGDGNAPLATQFNGDVLASAFDNFGNLYIADPLNNRIRKITFNVGVDDINPTEIATSLYPNPAIDELTISASAAIKNVVVVNTIGQTVTVRGTAVSDKDMLLDVSRLPAGIYFVRVNGTQAGKFVKQ